MPSEYAKKKAQKKKELAKAKGGKKIDKKEEEANGNGEIEKNGSSTNGSAAAASKETSTEPETAEGGCADIIAFLCHLLIIGRVQAAQNF